MNPVNNNLNLQDALLILSLALPSATSATTTSAALDLGQNVNGYADQFAPELSEFLLTAPALTTTQLPNAATVIYQLQSSANANLSSPTVLNSAAITQTGASSTGAAAATFRYRPPIDGVQRYLFFTATTSSTAGNCSAAKATLAAVF